MCEAESVKAGGPHGWSSRGLDVARPITVFIE